ncbi:WD repeat and FYVE domain containing protein 3 [Echinococcus multilocularis]|uniref:WD repeat and FYVE domain containing protein 3 n=1 Tax=Echinococcus multilocularis TaxID=6211 RepID=A0A068Y3I8_ECHMU|nr:WD repeat and FYVE domain containing protein 3 [Echinococcus multilocularis]
MKSFSSLQKQIKQLSESDQINLCRLNKLISSCKKCRDSIFYSSTFQDIFEYFPDVHVFCAFVSKNGSKLIADFLEDGLSDSLGLIEASTSPRFSQVPIGNLLLLTLEKLSCSASLLECMSAAGVPSTLVKCLYIFLDLPAVSNPDALKDRMHLQHKFTQLLQHVCLSSVAVEEMTSTDALRHLLSAAVDPCQSSNAFWRKSSCTILTTLAQNCLTQHVVQYIHDAGCITDYVERLKQIQLPKADSIEAFISLFQILSESSSTNSQLLDDFHAAGGYNIITDYLLKWVCFYCCLH